MNVEASSPQGNCKAERNNGANARIRPLMLLLQLLFPSGRCNIDIPSCLSVVADGKDISYAYDFNIIVLSVKDVWPERTLSHSSANFCGVLARVLKRDYLSGLMGFVPCDISRVIILTR